MDLYTSIKKNSKIYDLNFWLQKQEKDQIKHKVEGKVKIKEKSM